MFFRKRLQHKCFFVNFAKFLKVFFFYNNSGGCFCTFFIFPCNMTPNFLVKQLYKIRLLRTKVGELESQPDKQNKYACLNRRKYISECSQFGYCALGWMNQVEHLTITRAAYINKYCGRSIQRGIFRTVSNICDGEGFFFKNSSRKPVWVR